MSDPTENPADIPAVAKKAARTSVRKSARKADDSPATDAVLPSEGTIAKKATKRATKKSAAAPISTEPAPPEVAIPAKKAAKTARKKAPATPPAEIVATPSIEPAPVAAATRPIVNVRVVNSNTSPTPHPAREEKPHGVNEVSSPASEVRSTLEVRPALEVPSSSQAVPAPPVTPPPSIPQSPQAANESSTPRHQQQQHQKNPPHQNQQRPQQQNQPAEHKKNKFQNDKFSNGKKNRFEKNKNNKFSKNPNKPFDPDADRASAQFDGPKFDCEGMLEITPKGNGYLRSMNRNLEVGKDDPYVSIQHIQKLGLRPGVILQALAQKSSRGVQVVDIIGINGLPPADARRLPHFEELTAINPSKRIPFENDQNRFTTRVLDIVSPVGRGQRGLIVSPPRSGKTTLLLHIAESISQREDSDIHLMVLLVDERPEEVTEFKRALPGVEILASSNDEHPRNHCRIAELAIERAKRLVESGRHVFLLMDSITRLARAYNNNSQNSGRGVGSGGVTVGALEVPRRLFAAARNTRGGGSLTILATALIQTNSRADEAIFQEFKGTGNMEIVLDRKIAENYIYPAVDIFKSGTRREELLLPEHMLHKIHLIRRGLSGHKPLEAMERLTYFLKKFNSNAQMLLEIKG